MSEPQTSSTPWRDRNRDPEPLAVSPNIGAPMVGLGRTKFYELLENGTIRSIKVGRRRIVPVDALRSFLASGSAAE